MRADKVHVPSSGVKLAPYDRRASRSIEVATQLPIRNIDYTVIFARQMAEMRSFYGTTPGFALHRELGAKWIEYRALFFRDPDGNALEICAQM